MLEAWQAAGIYDEQIFDEERIIATSAPTRRSTHPQRLVDDIEVMNAGMNINIKDGIILSYGDSLYRGGDAEPKDVDVHKAFCDTLEEEFSAHFADFMKPFDSNPPSNGQLVMDHSGEQFQSADASTFGDSRYIFHDHCTENAKITSCMIANDCQWDLDLKDYSTGPLPAIFRFMLTASPDNDLISNMVDHGWDYMSNMIITDDDTDGDDVGRYLHRNLIENVPGTVSPVKAWFAFAQVPYGGSFALEPVWKFEVEMENNWYEAAVTVHAPYRIVSVVDWVSDSHPLPKKPEAGSGASYNVFKWGLNDPEAGERSIEKEHFDALASPLGWHSIPVSDVSGRVSTVKNTTTTWGNNIIAHENWEGKDAWEDNYRPDAGAQLTFDYIYNPKVTDGSEDAMIEAKKYINASITQLFYTSNLFHDLFYRYGFDEVAGNFQHHNFGRGGKGDDAVIVNAQDGSGFNNANFATPPDGQNGRCRMYLWNTANPYRDGDLEAGIVIHELGHGLSTRLTGGPANSACLVFGEAGGMGEGWGDFLATTIRSTKNYSDYPMGAWAANTPRGIRNFPYSLDTTVNPSTYKTLDKPSYWAVHATGEVWAEMLWVVSHRLIAKHGFSETLFPPAPLSDGTIPEGDFYRPAEYTLSGKRKPLIPKHGNSLMVQLVVNAMKLQPCNPSFFDARDAIINADMVLTGGENLCELWQGFAERGLGPNARVIGRMPWGGGFHIDDFSIPRIHGVNTVTEIRLAQIHEKSA
ncbi:hypothetical protein PHLCEN_2v4124 [Hermanssonia centrifuga]|uniref:Extracellular metalloproteinase n=1 Tax=Hermanssonia centrifuga TaxID=98765 RepID=A0A2R6PZ66_9APHY|nr:hypothetical protein PHLCEN_2v4124 [Hermanssonia centrifuga]